MKNFLKSKFYQTQTDYQYLAFFRIAIGFIALSDILSLRSDFKLFFSKEDTIIPQELMYLFTEYFNYLNPLYNFLKESNTLDTFYHIVPWLYIISLIFLILGLFTRVSVFIVIILQLIIFKSFPFFNYGFDQFLTMSFFYCFIFPVGKVYSLDNKIFPKNNIIKINFNYRIILAFHLSIVYFFAGLAKIISITWWNGEAVWRSMSSIYNNLFKISPYILMMVGIVTVIAETGYPILMSIKKTRKITLFLIIGMHIGIAFMLDLPMFAAIMITWNITAHFSLFKNKIFQ